MQHFLFFKKHFIVKQVGFFPKDSEKIIRRALCLNMFCTDKNQDMWEGNKKAQLYITADFNGDGFICIQSNCEAVGIWPT